VKRIQWLASAAAIALAVGTASAASAAESAAGETRLAPAYGDIGPWYGDIGPWYGDIGPWYGDIGPWYGDIGPWYGDIGPWYGDIGPWYGDIGAWGANASTAARYPSIEAFFADIQAFYGDIGPWYGDIGPWYGDIGPWYGDIGPWYGDIGPWYGDIGPWYGDIGPWYGGIGAFYGDIGPWYGDIGPWYGDIGPWYGDIGPWYGDIGPWYGDIGPWSGDIEAFWGDLGAFWSDIAPIWKSVNDGLGGLGAYGDDTADDYARLLGDLRDLVERSESSWSDAVELRTGQSFWDGFASDVLARYGIDLDDPASLAGMSALDRAMFFLHWHDGLMSFSGIDHLDHWMPMVNWSPALAQAQGEGSGVVIGLLDAPIEGDADLMSRVVYEGGFDNFSSSHGASVASLMAAGVDGQGVMGVAPQASIANYNPFDDTGTAGWADVTAGLAALGRQGASVVNMSLGIPGWTLNSDWSDVFADPDVAAHLDGMVIVKAAGNEGLAQTDDIAWEFSSGAQLLIVGSVNPAGRISAFSNTPGDACLLDDGVCRDENLLMNRFLVAPGELILSSDDAGGVMRRSGTSASAPLVAGAVALLHSRWPWLSGHAEESADIILRSARDLGAPGVDPVYGWGLLDIAASQRPLDLDSLVFYQSTAGGLRPISADSLRERNPGGRMNWSAGGAVVYAFESIGDTHRDFAVPLSSLLVGQSANLHGDSQRMQDYLGDRMTDWVGGAAGFTDVSTVTAALSDDEGWRLSMTVANRDPLDPVSDGSAPFQAGFVMENPSQGLTLQFGHGEGAMALNGRTGFGLFSDYDGESGGVNPVLGLASGGAYAGAALDVAPRLSLSMGVTQQTREHFFAHPFSGEETPIYDGLADYEAAAANLSAAFAATERVTLTAGYTRLYERTGVLGVQSLGPTEFGGAWTDAATFGASMAFDYGVSLHASATAGRTHGGSLETSGFAVADGGVLTSAFSVALAKTGVAGDSDRIRVSFGQPMHVEDGGLTFASAQVVNRETGEIGVVNETFGLSGQDREYALEALYAAPVLSGRGEVSAFGRAELRSDRTPFEQTGFAVGARFGVDF